MTEAANSPGPIAPSWVDVGNGYAVALDQGKVVCRNAKGQQLSALPKQVRESALVEELRELREQLALHEQQCKEAVDSWMVRSLPVSAAVIAAVWPDPAWRSALENAVIWPLDASGKAVPADAGFLRGVDQRGVGVVDTDGESRWLETAAVAIPHPVLLATELEDFRELATELSLSQQLSQLLRETFQLPAKVEADSDSVDSYDGGKFEMLTHAASRARNFGYRVSGGYAVSRIWEGGALREARFWIGADYPEEETETGELIWVDDKQRQLPITSLGPVAYSEGMRMASQIYAGRKVEEQGEED